MWIGFALEMLVAALLVVTITYCVILDRRLRALRSGEDGLKDVILGLNDATLRAQQSIQHLGKSGDEAGNKLTNLVREARALTDELSLMLEAGDNLANRLERASQSAGGRSKDREIFREAERAPLEKDYDDQGTDEFGLDEEPALLKALRNAR